MRIRLTVPKEHVDEDTLGLALQASMAVAQRQVQDGSVPYLLDAIDAGDVKWKPEPAAQQFEGFDLPKDVMARGWGDCDDLAPWWAAELRESGDDPDAKPIVYQSGPKRWHAVVERGDGSIDDPSRWAGMGKPGSPLPVTAPIKASDVSSIGFARLGSGATKARIDVPLYVKSGNIVGVALERSGEDPYDALRRATSGAINVLAFWGAPDDVIMRLHAITHILHGGTEDDFAAVTGCGYDELGDFVGALAHRVGAVTIKSAFHPDDAANIAATILDPLGIRNMVAPLAQSFVSNYASGLAQRGAQQPPPQQYAPPPPPPAPVPPAPPAATAAAQPATVGASRAPSRGRSGSSGSTRGGAPAGTRGSGGGGTAAQQAARAGTNSYQGQGYDDGYGGYGPAAQQFPYSDMQNYGGYGGSPYGFAGAPMPPYAQHRPTRSNRPTTSNMGVTTLIA